MNIVLYLHYISKFNKEDHIYIIITMIHIKKEPINHSSSFIDLIEEEEEEEGEEGVEEEEVQQQQQNNIKQECLELLSKNERLNAENIIYIMNLLIDNMFPEKYIVLIDPGFIPLYIKRRINTVNNDSHYVIEKRKDIMRYYFDHHQMNEYHYITVIPIHNNDHWSILIYLNKHRIFYQFDSLSPYHNEYIGLFITSLVRDNIIDAHKTTLRRIKTIQQIADFECGQYIIMYLYSFLKVIMMISNKEMKKYNNNTTLFITKQELERLLYTIKEDKLRDFYKLLSKYTIIHCIEEYRNSFLSSLIKWIYNVT